MIFFFLTLQKVNICVVFQYQLETLLVWRHVLVMCRWNVFKPFNVIQIESDFNSLVSTLKLWRSINHGCAAAASRHLWQSHSLISGHISPFSSSKLVSRQAPLVPTRWPRSFTLWFHELRSKENTLMWAKTAGGCLDMRYLFNIFAVEIFNIPALDDGVHKWWWWWWKCLKLVRSWRSDVKCITMFATDAALLQRG